MGKQNNIGSGEGVEQSSTTDVSVLGIESGPDFVSEKVVPATSDITRPVEIGQSIAPADAEATAGPEQLQAENDLPNGGWKAWLQVAGAFAMLFNGWGIVNGFGVFQTYYQMTMLPDSAPDAISWVGSVQGFLLLGGSFVAGPLFDAGYFRVLITVGSLLVVLGFMMLSLATQYWHVLLAQGFCIGLGAGGLVLPSLATLPQYFGGSRRALATGIAVTGSSLGGVVYPLAFTSLSKSLGFGWANRVLGLMALVSCGAGVAALRTRAPPRRVRSLVDPSAFREAAYYFYCLAMFFSNLGFFVPIFYLQPYALSHGLTDTNVALNLVAMLNAASVLGRLAPAAAVHYLGPINTMFGLVGMTAVVTFCWVAVEGAAGNVVFALLYGFASGGIVSMPAVVLASITADLGFLGARMGTSSLFNAVSSLCGPPVAGAILRSTGGTSYLGLQLFAAFIFSVTTLCLMGARIAHAGPGLLVKA